jgi:hypothetical protein
VSHAESIEHVRVSTGEVSDDKVGLGKSFDDLDDDVTRPVVFVRPMTA